MHILNTITFSTQTAHTLTHGVSSTYQSLSSILSKRESVHRCVFVCVCVCVCLNALSLGRECEVERESVMCVGKCVLCAPDSPQGAKPYMLYSCIQW